jgi:tRNA (guanine37-N1)-methyltransferase
MVMRVDCVVSAIEAAEAASGQRLHRVLLSPQGARFDQRRARAFAEKPGLMFICGRYEGFDERVNEHVDEALSLGDFVLAGGEVAAMAMIEAVARLLPGVLGNRESVVEESFSEAQNGLLEYPQYTRPPEFRGSGVPEVLKSGDHGKIAQARTSWALERTERVRPDLLDQKAEPEPGGES